MEFRLAEMLRRSRRVEADYHLWPERKHRSWELRWQCAINLKDIADHTLTRHTLAGLHTPPGTRRFDLRAGENRFPPLCSFLNHHLYADL